MIFFTSPDRAAPLVFRLAATVRPGARAESADIARVLRLTRMGQVVELMPQKGGR